MTTTIADDLTQDSDDLTQGSLPILLRRYGGKTAWYAFAIGLALFVLAPIVLFYSRAFGDGAAAIRNLTDVPNLATILVNTIALAAGATVVAAVLAVTLAVLVMRVPVRWRGLAAFLPQLPLVIPPVASIVGWIFIFAPTVGYGNTLLRSLPFFDRMSEGPVDVYSMPAIIIITGTELTGIVFAFVFARMHEISGSLVAAAKLSGASAFRSFTTITLPLLRPSLVASLVVAFLLGLGQFTAPLLLGSADGIDVLTTEIFHIREKFPIDYAATAALGLPLLILGIGSILVQRAVIGDQRRYVTQGVGGNVSTQTSRWALAGVVSYSFVTCVLPLLAITLVAFSPFWNGDLTNLLFTTKHVETTLSNPIVSGAVWNSITTSVIAAVIVLPLGFIGALVMSGVVKSPRPIQYILDFVFVGPLAVPRAMLGLSVLYVFLRPPFNLYGTLTLFVVGYVFIVLPFSLRSQHASLVGMHSSLFEASRICGAGQLRTILDIALPLAKRGMAASLAVMIVLLSHDFAVSVMLRSPGNHVMGTAIFEFWEGGVYPQVAVMALVMSAVTGILLAVTVWIGGRSALQNM
ncbi:ABC transporter permease [Rhodococcus opacus]|uniref:ABC transporter permease n=1 Tax=Rhodococcus opacus TaxID=37919 RepID=UPI001C43EDC4|nr:ABC transporter permease subunit [Rhodococcus opacus]MBV6760381.1 ABC transporter permease subunit [Rhodococcus opacus]